jgi:hypothetical protein
MTGNLTARRGLGEKNFSVRNSVRNFDFSEVVAEVHHFSVGAAFGGLTLAP